MSVNLSPQAANIDRTRRWRALGQHGATVWLTGLPGAGKTTIATELEARLLDRGRSAYRLDGDILRDGVCSDLGFTRVDREANVGRVGELARMFADSGTVAIVALVSPYIECRQKVRELHEHDGLTFIEVFVNTPSAECARRDPKGLYARAQNGSLEGLTGVDAPYEAPREPEIELTPASGVAECADIVMAVLDERLRRAA